MKLSLEEIELLKTGVGKVIEQCVYRDTEEAARKLLKRLEIVERSTEASIKHNVRGRMLLKHME